MNSVELASTISPPNPREHWATAALGDFLLIIRGISFPAGAKRSGPGEGLIGCLRTSNVQAQVEWDDLWFVPERYLRSPEQVVRNHDILISLANSFQLVGKVALIGRMSERSTLGAFISAIRVPPELDARFVYYQLTSTQMQAAIRAMASTTTNISNVSVGKLVQLPIRLAPAPEQSRISDRIDELFTDLDAGVAAIERVRRKLKRYRSAVLHAAVTGRLTASWRAQHGPPEESGADLFKRVLDERRRQWEARTLAKYERDGRTPPKGWQARYPQPANPKTDGLPELPDDWCWASHDQVGNVQLGRQRSPQHHSGKDMRPYLRVANVYEDRINTDDVKRMNFTPREFENYELRFGDILLNEGQSMELVGRPAMYRSEIPGCCFQNTLVRQRVFDGVLADYALIVALAQFRTGRYRKIASITTSIAHLGAERFASVEFPLPPSAEQTAIVETVLEKLSQIDAMEVEVRRSLVRGDRLRQAILKSAFAGKLVAQDPNDEPAAALLDRIKALRTEELAAKRAAGNGPPAKSRRSGAPRPSTNGRLETAPDGEARKTAHQRSRKTSKK
ncbi:MAG: hypothetical protein EXQ69_06075 [Acidimicrobiia bacterium]|nr:hypothetical protein [Acidimicrobiia bacterium]